MKNRTTTKNYGQHQRVELCRGVTSVNSNFGIFFRNFCPKNSKNVNIKHCKIFFNLEYLLSVLEQYILKVLPILCWG